MRGPGEALVFVGLAAALHLAAAAWAARVPPSDPAAGGTEGAETVRFLGATAQMEATVLRWEAPPETAVPRPRQAAPEAPALPDPPATVIALPPARPEAPSLLSAVAGAPPVVVTAPVRPTTSTPETETQPAPKAASRLQPQPPGNVEPAPEPRPRQTPRRQSQAAGAGGGGSAGPGKAQQAAQPSQAQIQQLQAAWGGQIRARIIARLRPPKNTRGTVLLRITVTREGRIASAGIARASGSTALDRAALGAVRRTGRVARAPEGLTEPSYRFDLPIAVK